MHGTPRGPLKSSETASRGPPEGLPRMCSDFLPRRFVRPKTLELRHPTHDVSMSYLDRDVTQNGPYNHWMRTRIMGLRPEIATNKKFTIGGVNAFRKTVAGTMASR